jgi:endonuclease/exonuclease/phosphatase family metal-dependent hydrolase
MRSMGRLEVLLVLVGWVIVALLAVVAVMRLVAWDAIEPFAVANALTMLIYLPAWVVAALGAVCRRWLLAAAACVLVAAQLVFVAPELMAATPVPTWARNGWKFRLFDANVDQSEEFLHGYSHAITQFRPDIVAMEEFTPGSLRQLQRSGVLDQFHFRCLAPRYGPSGFLVASRLSMRRCQIRRIRWKGRSTAFMVSATVDTPEGPLQLRVVHTLAPFPAYWQAWAAALRAIDAAVRAGSTRRLLMVGDFNATWNNRGFSALLDDGLTDAAAARGQAFAMTWPNGAAIPPFVRIDHILTGKRLVVTSISAHPGFGSDHQYLTAEVAVERDG